MSNKISVWIKPFCRFWKLKNCKMPTTRSGPKDGRRAPVTPKKKPARTWKKTDDTLLQMLFDKFENNKPGGFDHRDMPANNILLCQQQKFPWTQYKNFATNFCKKSNKYQCNCQISGRRNCGKKKGKD